MHGVIMVFFFLVPVVPAVLGNFCLPLMIGAKDLAFPRINLLSWYLYMIGGSLDSVRDAHRGCRHRLDLLHALQLPVDALQRGPHDDWHRPRRFFVALHRSEFHRHVHWLRAPGMTWFRLPLFVWTIYATSFIFLLAVRCWPWRLILVILERLLHIGIFDPALGGDPLLFQHLFWFYSHPAVYIMILPGMGIVSEVIPCFRARPSSATRSSPIRRSASPFWAFWSGRTTCSWPASRCTRR